MTATNRLPVSLLDELSQLAVGGAGRDTLEVHCPFDDAPLGRLPVTTADEVAEAFARARSEQARWAALPLDRRARIGRRFSSLVLRDRDLLLDLVQAETGKSRASAFEEVADVVQWANYLSRHSAAILRERRRPGALSVLTQTRERHVPKGVVGVITPWNYPLTLPATDVLPALIAGNGVVLKPDSQTPFTALYVARLLYRAGVPRDLLQVVVGPGSALGTPIVDGSDYLMFTGSTATGRHLAQQCAARLIGFSGELGGKNPLLVLEDADPLRAARGAINACFSNSGQLCISVERIYVHDRHWDAFVSEFVALTRGQRLAPGFDWDADMGSLIGEKQLRTVSGRAQQAVSAGATVLAGGRARPDLGPYFYEPTVLTDVTPACVLHREETFGPVVSLYRVASDEEAVSAANDTEYGLSASVWGGRSAPSIARRIRAGAVNINEGYAAAWASHAAPMGGMGQSGVGRRHGEDGLKKYTEPQTVARQRLIPIGGPFGLDRQRWANLLTAGVRILGLLP